MELAIIQGNFLDLGSFLADIFSSCSIDRPHLGCRRIWPNYYLLSCPLAFLLVWNGIEFPLGEAVRQWTDKVLYFFRKYEPLLGMWSLLHCLKLPEVIHETVRCSLCRWPHKTRNAYGQSLALRTDKFTFKKAAKLTVIRVPWCHLIPISFARLARGLSSQRRRLMWDYTHFPR